ncbi:hypothetical protein PV325_004956, partial [Microctonus aethiopoides]
MADKKVPSLATSEHQSPSPTASEKGDATDSAESGRNSPTQELLLNVPTTATRTRTPSPATTTAAPHAGNTLRTPAAKLSASAKPTVAATTPATTSAAERKNLRSASPIALSTELSLKMHSQMSRLQQLEKMLTIFSQSTDTFSTAVADDHLSVIEMIHKAFLKEHAYFEVTWPREHIDHEYWTDSVFLQESMLYSRLRNNVMAKRESPPVHIPSAAATAIIDTTEASHKLPELTIAPFTGDGYVQGPIAHL